MDLINYQNLKYIILNTIMILKYKQYKAISTIKYEIYKDNYLIIYLTSC